MLTPIFEIIRVFVAELQTKFPVVAIDSEVLPKGIYPAEIDISPVPPEDIDKGDDVSDKLDAAILRPAVISDIFTFLVTLFCTIGNSSVPISGVAT